MLLNVCYENQISMDKDVRFKRSGISKGVLLNVIHLNSVLKIFLSLATSFVTRNHNKVQQKSFSVLIMFYILIMFKVSLFSSSTLRFKDLVVTVML